MAANGQTSGEMGDAARSRRVMVADGWERRQAASAVSATERLTENSPRMLASRRNRLTGTSWAMLFWPNHIASRRSVQPPCCETDHRLVSALRAYRDDGRSLAKSAQRV